jgi:hypothetical protein
MSTRAGVATSYWRARCNIEIGSSLTALGLLLVVSCLSSCSSNSVQTDSSAAVVSLKNEHGFWRNWINTNKEVYSPLEPFNITSTSRQLIAFDKKIKELGKANNAVLFVRINIDNGVFQVVYYSWDVTSDVYSFVVLDDISGHLKSGTNLKAEPQFSNIFTSIGDEKTHGEYEGGYIFDADSVYLTISVSNKKTRYGLYNPDIADYDDFLAPVIVAKYIKRKGINETE